MGIFKKVALTGLWGIGTGMTSVGAGMAYLLSSTSLVTLTEDDQMCRTKTWAKYNPKNNPAFKDTAIKSVPLSKIRPELRNDEKALTLEFCRGVWGRWGFWTQSRLQERFDKPPGTGDNLWQTSDLAVSEYDEGLRFSNHFEVVANTGDEITVRCGGSPLQRGLRESDGLLFLSAKIDQAQQQAVFYFKSGLFNSSAPKVAGARISFPAAIVFLHGWYARILTDSGVGNVTV
ncbi:hypothetical protein GGS21DRAFT_186100 [Xylaria nigripes]|nr:hypothetical protein GGS21DRAFT_186100 [Xylaria nigripes]